MSIYDKTKDVVERVMLWGGGKHAIKVYKLISCFYSEEYEILGISDKCPDSIRDNWTEVNIPLYSHEEAKSLFDEGVFEKVIIGISPKFNIKKIIGEIESMGMKVIGPKNYSVISARDVCVDEFEIADNCMAYRVNDVHVAYDSPNYIGWIYDDNNHIYLESANPILAFDRIVDAITIPFTKKRRNIIDDETCVLAKLNSINYSHFLYEVLPVIFKMEMRGFEGKYLLSSTSFAHQYCDILGIETSRIIWVGDSNSDIEYYVKRAILFQPQSWERHVNDDKYTIKYEKTIKEMSDYIISKLKLKEKPQHKRLYIARSNRILENLQGSKWLDDNGFITVMNERLSVREEIENYYNADIVMGTIGAASSNVIYMRQGTCFIETFPRRFISYWTYVYCAWNNIHYQMIVEHDTPWLIDKVDKCESRNYHIDIKLIEMAVANAVKLIDA